MPFNTHAQTLAQLTSDLTEYSLNLDYEQAARVCREAAAWAEAEGDVETQAEMLSLLSTCSLQMGDHKQAKTILSQIDRLNENHSLSKRAEGMYHLGLGQYYLKIGRPDSALGYAQSAMGHASLIAQKYPPIPSDIHMLLGGCYTWAGALPLAVNEMEAALTVAKQIGAEKSPAYGLILSGMGYMHAQLQQYTQADQELWRALELIQHSPSLTDRANVYNHFASYFLTYGAGKISENQKSFDQYTPEVQEIFHDAQSVSEKCLALLELANDPILLAMGYMQLAEGLSVKDDPTLTQTAYQYLEKAKDLIESQLGKNNYYYFIAMLKLGQTKVMEGAPYFNSGQLPAALAVYREAQPFLNQSIELAKELFGDRSPAIGYPLNMLATSEVQIGLGTYFLGNVEKGISVLQHAKELFDETAYHFGKSKETLPPYNQPKIDRFTQFNAIQFPLDVNGDIFRRFPFFAEDTVTAYKNSLAYYLAESSMIDSFLLRYGAQADQLSIISFAQGATAGAIAMGHELYHRTGAFHYLEMAFEQCEKSKSSLLLTTLRQRKALKFAGVPDSLIELENQLRESLISKQQLTEIHFSDSTNIANNQDYLATLKAHERLTQSINESYPRYYNQRLNLSKVPAQEVQSRLGVGQVFMEFFTVEGDIYIFALTQDTLMVNYVPGLAVHYRLADSLLSAIHPSPNADRTELFTQYTDVAYYLYKEFLQPTLSQLDTVSELIIIPDEGFDDFPFELLLTELPSSNEVDYRLQNLSYLIEEVAITYGFSATTLFNDLKQAKKGHFSYPFFGLSPTFERHPSQNNLPGAQEEVEMLTDRLGGKILQRESATLDSFLAYSPQSAILHLATHAVANNADPLSSVIYFYDTVLTAAQLYEKEIPANLVVLSACQTHKGENSDGEGLMSLARGFAYAGTPSIVTTMWDVDDEEGKKLMELFYEHLLDGMPKHQALRLAKLKYLRKADRLHSHPSNWATLIHIGDTQPLEKDHTEAWIIGLIIFAVIGIGVWVAFGKA